MFLRERKKRCSKYSLCCPIPGGGYPINGRGTLGYSPTPPEQTHACENIAPVILRTRR